MNHTKSIKNKPLLSVIIPCYNAEKTIKITLSSLERQTFFDFEVILINDGSFDNSDKVITNYLEDSRLKVKYIIQDNSGVSTARNVGLGHAQGEYITFLDADDIYHKDFLSLLTENIQKYDTDTAYCCYGRKCTEIYNDMSKCKIESIKQNKNEVLLSFMYRRGPCAFFTFIYKRSLIKEFNLLFDNNTKYGEDLEFTWKYLSYCQSGIFINRILYGYYDNPNSAVNNMSWRHTEAIEAIIRVKNYFQLQDNDFYIKIKEYMIPRTIWAITKDFAVYNRIDLFKRILEQYDIKNSMKDMIENSNNIFIRITSRMFCLSPKLFYCFFSILGKIK